MRHISAGETQWIPMYMGTADLKNLELLESNGFCTR